MYYKIVVMSLFTLILMGCDPNGTSQSDEDARKECETTALILMASEVETDRIGGILYWDACQRYLYAY